MLSEAMKGYTAAPATIPLSSLHPNSGESTGTTFSKLRPVSTKSQQPATTREANGEHTTLTAHPHKVTTAFPRSTIHPRSSVPGSKGHGTPTGPKSPWSPSLSQRLSWCMRQYTPAQLLVSLAFIFASVTLFSALAGIGYVSSEPDHFVTGWRTPGPEILRHDWALNASPSKMFQGFLRVVGFEGASAGAYGQDEEEELYHLDVKTSLAGFVRRRLHRRPRFGTSHTMHKRAPNGIGHDSIVRAQKQHSASARDEDLFHQRTDGSAQAQNPEGGWASRPGQAHMKSEYIRAGPDSLGAEMDAEQ
ncbi:hypothetical protein JB92DRAFT_2873758 [Gautieria morchelliformis]|nr:hypothetical protein JB92DRAFT_2873758 [Gautieria morchelliformis]